MQKVRVKMRSKRCEQDEEQLELGRPRLVDFLKALLHIGFKSDSIH